MRTPTRPSFSLLILTLVFLLQPPGGFCQVPGLLNYQGKISIGSTPFTGTGQFKFALVNAAGTTTFWSNDGSSTAGAAPSAAVSLPVVNGLYFIQLGDTSLANMTTLPHAVFQNADVRLRVWFNDGVAGFEQIAPDQRIAAVGYAMMAGAVPNGAITSSMIAAGAVGSSQIAAGAIGNAQLAAGAVQSANIAAGAVGGTQLAAGAVQSANIAAGAVGTSQLADFAVNSSKVNFGLEEGTAAGGTMTASAGTLTLSRSFALPYQTPPSVTLQTPGWTLGAVTATGFTATIPFTPVTADGVGNVGLEGALAIVNGHPAVSYYDAPNGDLKYIRANDSNGQTWPLPVTVDGGSDIAGLSSSLAVVNGNPAITYYDADGQNLKYVRATNADGTAWGTQVVIDSAGDVGWFTSLTVVNGRPAVCYYDKTNGRVKYARASDATGATWAAPVVVDNVGAGVGTRMSMKVVGGHPAIAYYDQAADDLKYARANDTDGAAGQWGTPVIVDATGNVGVAPSLAIVDGRPAISYFDSTNFSLKYVRAAEATGAAWGASLTLDSSGDVGVFNSLAVINGTPAIAYFDQANSDLRFIRSLDSRGVAWGPPFVVDNAGIVGRDTSMVALNGGAAISYYDDTNLDLKFALVPDLLWRASDGSKAMLTAAAVADGAVGSAQLAAGAVQGSNIANGAVGSTQIAAGAIQGTNIANGAISSTQIAAGAIQGTNIANGAISSMQIAAGAVQATNIASGAVGAAQIAAGAVGSSELAAGSVGAGHLAADAVEFGDLALGYQSGVVDDSNIQAEFSYGYFTVTFPRAFNAVPPRPPVVTLSLRPQSDNVPGDITAQVISTSTTGFTGRVGPFVNSITRLNASRNISMALIGGRASISYFDDSSNKIYFLRSANNEGTEWDTNDRVQIIGVAPVNVTNLCLAEIGGRPAVVFSTPDFPHIYYLRADDALGSSWSGFGTGNGGAASFPTYGGVRGMTFCEINGKPAFSFIEPDFSRITYYRRDVDGSPMTGLTVVNESPGDELTGSASLADIGGTPAIVYVNATTDTVKYLRASNPDGSIWGPPITIASSSSVTDAKLAAVNLHPAVVYGGLGAMYYRRAVEPTGTLPLGWGDPVQLTTTRGTPYGFSTVFGSPAVCFSGVTDGLIDFKYIQASDAYGHKWRAARSILRADVISDASLLQTSAGPIVSFYDRDDGRAAIVTAVKAGENAPFAINWIAVEPGD